MPTGDSIVGRARPTAGFKFSVECSFLSGVTSFSKVTGLEDESTVIEYREGQDPATMSKFPGLSTFPNLVLERGTTTDRSLIRWRERVIRIDKTGGNTVWGNEDYAADLQINMWDRGGKLVRLWVVHNAWPAKLSHGDLDASSSEILIMSLELAHEGLVAH